MARRLQIARTTVATGTGSTPGTAVCAVIRADHDRMVLLTGRDAGIDLEIARKVRAGTSGWAPVVLNGPAFMLGAGQDIYVRATLRTGTTALTQPLGFLMWPMEAKSDG